MDSVQRLLPQDKFDLGAVAKLAAQDFATLEPIVPQLLTWLQDINWPVAIPMGRVLAALGEPMVPHVETVLRGDDGWWKYCCINGLVKAMPPQTKRLLAPELTRLATQPTDNDRFEEVHIAAQEVLDSLG